MTWHKLTADSLRRLDDGSWFVFDNYGKGRFEDGQWRDIDGTWTCSDEDLLRSNDYWTPAPGQEPEGETVEAEAELEAALARVAELEAERDELREALSDASGQLFDQAARAALAKLKDKEADRD